MINAIRPLIALLMSLYRPWLGGFFQKSGEQGGGFANENFLTKTMKALGFLRLPVGIAIPAYSAFIAGLPIWFCIFIGVGVFFIWRGHGHGPMLSFPLKGNPNKSDWLLEFINAVICDNETSHLVRYMTYAALRYTLPIYLVLALPTFIMGANAIGFLVASFVIPAGYYFSIRYLAGKLPFYANYPAESVAGLAIGLALLVM